MAEAARERRRAAIDAASESLRVSLATASAALIRDKRSVRASSGRGPPDSPPATGDAPGEGTTAWTLKPIVENLQQPTSLSVAPDGRLFIAERTGQVRVVSRDGRVVRLFLDLELEVDSGGERGLLSIALDPAFAENGRVFLLLTRQQAGEPEDRGRATGQVVSVAANDEDPDLADRSTLRVLVSRFYALTQLHAGGDLAFDRRGRLLASFGDGSSDRRVDRRALSSQDLDSLAGKLIRVDRESGAGVPDNPWFDERRPQSVRSKVLAFGLRNPFRISVDPVDGAVWIGDVGWTSWEEVNRVPPDWRDTGRSLNFGWPCREGPAAEKSYARDPATRSACALLARSGRTAMPHYAYPHQGRGGSVTLGPALRTRIQPGASGRVIVADFIRQTLGTLDSAGSFRALQDVGSSTSGGANGKWGSIVDIAAGQDGNLLLVNLGAGAIATLQPGAAESDREFLGPLTGWAVILLAAGAGILVMAPALITQRRQRALR